MARILLYSSAVRVHDLQAYRKMIVTRDVTRTVQTFWTQAQHTKAKEWCCLKLDLLIATERPNLESYMQTGLDLMGWWPAGMITPIGSSCYWHAVDTDHKCVLAATLQHKCLTNCVMNTESSPRGQVHTQELELQIITTIIKKKKVTKARKRRVRNKYVKTLRSAATVNIFTSLSSSPPPPTPPLVVVVVVV